MRNQKLATAKTQVHQQELSLFQRHSKTRVPLIALIAQLWPIDRTIGTRLEPIRKLKMGVGKLFNLRQKHALLHALMWWRNHGGCGFYCVMDLRQTTNMKQQPSACPRKRAG